MTKLDYKTKSNNELNKELITLKKKLFDYMFEVKTGKEKNYDNINLQKKEIARIYTIINDKNRKVVEDKKTITKIKKDKT